MALIAYSNKHHWRDPFGNGQPTETRAYTQYARISLATKGKMVSSLTEIGAKSLQYTYRRLPQRFSIVRTLL